MKKKKKMKKKRDRERHTQKGKDGCSVCVGEISIRR